MPVPTKCADRVEAGLLRRRQPGVQRMDHCVDHEIWRGMGTGGGITDRGSERTGKRPRPGDLLWTSRGDQHHPRSFPLASDRRGDVCECTEDEVVPAPARIAGIQQYQQLPD
jgi:hypothetical protein